MRCLWKVRFENIFLKAPNTKEEWLAISNGFENRWNFRNSIKHVAMQAPVKSGSSYINYKKTHILF